jgi:hypothetical protein
VAGVAGITLAGIPSPIVVGDEVALAGTGFTPGSVVKL